MKVVIAEDHYLVREGTRRILEESGVSVVAAVGTAVELLDAVDRLRPDAVITDIRMPPGHHTEGLAAAHEIQSRFPAVGVVVLSQHANEQYAFTLFQHGTDGLAYLLKERVGDVNELLRALHEVIAGRSVIDPRIVEVLVRNHTKTSESPLASLTARELEVLGQMAQGKSNRAVAEALALAESTVEKHVNAVFAKLDLGLEQSLHRRVAAVLTFLRHDPAGA